MRTLLAPLVLVSARGRRPSRWLATVTGLAVATTLACGVVGEATIAADQAARAQLQAAPALDRVIRITAQGPGSAALAVKVRGLLAGIGLSASTRVVLLNPVRLGGVIVRPAAISPGGGWLTTRAPGPCRATDCPVLALAPLPRHRPLAAPGVRLRLAGQAMLASAVPLGFAPAAGGGAPVVLSGDAVGLDRLPALASVYRTQNWLEMPDLARLHSWQLGMVAARLQHLQAMLPADGSLTLTAPFAALHAARAQAARAPRGLLVAGGGALAGLAGFLVLCGYALRSERAADRRRLAAAGATTAQGCVFAIAEAGLLAALGLLAGAGLGVAVTAGLAAHAGLPAGAIVDHSLLSAAAAPTLAGAWLLASALIALMLLAPAGRIADVLALAGAAALALSLTRGTATGGPPALLLAPLACLSAGVLAYRGATVVLRAAERLSRRGPAVLRLALVSLARAPTGPALAIACLAVSTGLGGFALAYRATLERGESDAAADRVPLDAVIGPSAAFTTPLALAPARRWQILAHGTVLAVRRTDASYARGAAAVTVPAIGVPAAGLAGIRGWRASDGSAPLAQLARRLAPRGPVRTPGPGISPGTKWLVLATRTRGGAAVITADLRQADGGVTAVTLGTASPRAGVLRARVPPGRFELEALSLSAPTGLAITSGHQNGEDAAAATQAAAIVTLGPLRAAGRSSAGDARLAIGGWRAAGGAQITGSSPIGGGRLRVGLSEGGQPGVVRPPQPSDVTPIPVLADPGTAGAAAGERLSLTIDGLPVTARVVGTVRRFPTLAPGAAGVLVADEATLAGALDASLPGAGRADELWLAAPRLGALQAALRRPPLNVLSASFRVRVKSALKGAAVALAVMGTLLAAAAVGVLLALLALLVALLGPMRDADAERELAVAGLGPRALRAELRMRLLTTGAAGLLAGAGLALLLTRLTLAAVHATGTLSPGAPPLVSVVPWSALAAGALLTFAGLAVVAAAGARIRAHPR
jgi:hypothetical protein